MSTPHNEAKKGDIAQSVLMPGDPLRAKFIAENFFDNPVCFNTVRNMLGFTGTYKGKRVSTMGSGMGLPSISIYATELYKFYDVQNIIRIGTCGCADEDIHVGSVVMAQSASTNSAINRRVFGGDFAACADFGMLYSAYNLAMERELTVYVRNILSSDTFYHDDVDESMWAKYGVRCTEMESNALYTIAARMGRKALGLFTVSDHQILDEELSPKEREQNLSDMILLALDTAIAQQ